MGPEVSCVRQDKGSYFTVSDKMGPEVSCVRQDKGSYFTVSDKMGPVMNNRGQRGEPGVRQDKESYFTVSDKMGPEVSCVRQDKGSYFTVSDKAHHHRLSALVYTCRSSRPGQDTVTVSYELLEKSVRWAVGSRSIELSEVFGAGCSQVV
ncbi:hypothetical protein RRG08_049265 [Elysia crispata]|uniref:Uncharacterized protein n=1 Tax=Elysia crispata TaxID=231223 RepID=A0AAE0ZNR9_9GAST|nr:hypothetical protein RRG08_049265 [Elysia crispata]